jgi:hypothetical protein
MIEQKYLRIVRAVQRAELPAEVGSVLKAQARARGPPRVRSSGSPAGRLETFNRPYRGSISKKALFRRFASTLTSGYTPPAHFGAVKGHPRLPGFAFGCAVASRLPGFAFGCAVASRLPGFAFGCAVASRLPGFAFGCAVASRLPGY